MSNKIQNFGKFSDILVAKIKDILMMVANDVKKEIDEAIMKYYSEYEPGVRGTYYTYWYHRTDQLKKSCKIGKPKIVGDTVSVEIYLDYQSINYETPGSDPYKTVVAANAGLHGGWDISNFASGQVSWSSISSNDGSRWGIGTQIWEDPVNKLFGNGNLIQLFKKYAKQRGLTIV